MAGGNKGALFQTKRKGDILSHPVYAGETIYRGCMINIGTHGFAKLGSDTASEIFAGMAEEAFTAAQCVTSGAKNVRVRRRGIFKMKLATTAAAPTLVGSLVYVDTKQTSSVDELVDIAANVTNKILVGLIAKHGTDAQAIAGTNTIDVWVDILGTAMTVYDATYASIATLAAYTTGDGAQDVGVEDSTGYGTSKTVQDALEAVIANGQIAIPITAFTEEDGTILTKTADATIGFKQVGNEEVVLQVAAAETFAVVIGLPDDVNGAADMTLDLVVVKNGTDADDATMNLEAFAAATGAAINSGADAYAGAAKAIVDNVNIQVLSYTLANAQLPTAARTLTAIFTPAGSDEIYILGAALKYTRTLA